MKKDNKIKYFLMLVLYLFIFPIFVCGQTTEYEMGVSEGEEYIFTLNRTFPKITYKRKVVVDEISIDSDGLMFIKTNYTSWFPGEYNESKGELVQYKFNMDPHKVEYDDPNQLGFTHLLITPAAYIFIPTPVNLWLQELVKAHEDEDWAKKLSVSGSTLTDTRGGNEIKITFNDKGVKSQVLQYNSNGDLSDKVVLEQNFIPSFNITFLLSIICFFSVSLAYSLVVNKKIRYN